MIAEPDVPAEVLSSFGLAQAPAELLPGGQGRSVRCGEVAQPLADLQRMTRPVTGRPQLIHGDLAGNVLFCDALAPAIIDFSPYWRPVEYADAIVAVDGMLWFGADRTLLRAAASGSQFAQYLVRAALFRLVALNERARDDGSGLEELDAFHRVIAEVAALHQPPPPG